MRQSYPQPHAALRLPNLIHLPAIKTSRHVQGKLFLENGRAWHIFLDAPALILDVTSPRISNHTERERVCCRRSHALFFAGPTLFTSLKRYNNAMRIDAINVHTLNKYLSSNGYPLECGFYNCKNCKKTGPRNNGKNRNKRGLRISIVEQKAYGVCLLPPHPHALLRRPDLVHLPAMKQAHALAFGGRDTTKRCRMVTYLELFLTKCRTYTKKKRNT